MVGRVGDHGNGRGICQSRPVQRNILPMSEQFAQNDAGRRPRRWPESRSRRPPPVKRDRSPPAAAARAVRFDLLADSTVEQALGCTLRHCLAHLGANQVCVLGRDVLKLLEADERIIGDYLFINGVRFRARGAGDEQRRSGPGAD